MYRLIIYLIVLIVTIINPVIGQAQEEIRPSFPGGPVAFKNYILKNLKYPDVAAAVGLTGKVYVRFIIEKDGSASHVIPYRCLGAGCESEAIRVISLSPKWKPGKLYGESDRFEYIIPISFFPNGPSKPTELSKLRKSKYGFVFYIKGTKYNIDEAEGILGKSFDPAMIETVENYENPKYAMPDKKGIYLIVMKSS